MTPDSDTDFDQLRAMAQETLLGACRVIHARWKAGLPLERQTKRVRSEMAFLTHGLDHVRHPFCYHELSGPIAESLIDADPQWLGERIKRSDAKMYSYGSQAAPT